MRARWGFIPLAVGPLLSASVLAAQTGDPPTVFLPLILNADSMTPAPSVVQLDSQVLRHRRRSPRSWCHSLRGSAAPPVFRRSMSISRRSTLKNSCTRIRPAPTTPVHSAIGVVRELPQPVSPAGAGAPGHWQQTADGGRYWTLTIESPEAKAIRVKLENLIIPPGGHVMSTTPATWLRSTARTSSLTCTGTQSVDCPCLARL